MTNYPYISKNVLADKISYSYARFKGRGFLEAWKYSRKKLMTTTEAIEPFKQNFHDIGKGDINSGIMLDGWSMEIENEKFDYTRLNLLVKRFEVTKRIYGQYDENYRPTDKTNFKYPVLYLKFAGVLTLAFEKTNKLPYLNALIKVNDIICGIYESFEIEERRMIQWIFSKEIHFVEILEKSLLDAKT